MWALRRQFSGVGISTTTTRPQPSAAAVVHGCCVALAGHRLPCSRLIPRRCLHHRDPYQLLGIAPTDDVAEIKRAFRTRALTLHPDRAPEGQRAEALEQFNAVVEAYELLCRSDQDWRFRQEADFAQFLRDELEWARARLRSQRARVLGTGKRGDPPNVSSTPPRTRLRSKKRRDTRIRKANSRTAKVEALELEQEIEQELAWAHARAAAAREQSGAPSVQHEVAAAARRLAQLGINVDQVNSRNRFAQRTSSADCSDPAD